ncbi:MAG: peroxiredoxin [Planctomycetota bacterium]
MPMHLKVGAKAPAFTLKDHGGRKVKLSDFRGKWVVLYFYPKDGTSACTTEACEFTEGLAAFGRMGAKVIGISPDSPESHARFAEKNELKHILLSDPEHEVIEDYGAWGEKSMYGRKMMGVIRSTWLVSPEGKLAFHWPKVKAAGHAEEVRAKLAEIRRAGRKAA